MKDVIRMNQQIEKIVNSQEIIIYGAGLMGKNLFTILTSSVFNKRIKAFIVREKDGNPDYIDDVPVFAMNDAVDYKNKLTLVALHEKHLNGAMKELRENGYVNLLPVSFDNDLWCDMREEWINANSIMPFGTEMLRESCEKILNKNLHIYVVHSAYDKELNENIEDKPYEISIQVGANLTDKVLFPVCDNTGENISEKNKKYCELTALYWAWKNDKSEYIGLSHYRRKFVLSEGEISTILSGNVDIVVTVPVMNLETVKEQYVKDHSETDWNILGQAIEVLSPDYKDAYNVVSNNTFYFAYNMFIAKKEVLNDYCEWLFKILEYCEDKIGSKDDVYQNRYVGFLAERLLTIYIAKHTELKVKVAHKHFIETKEKAKNVVIYGAQGVALGTYNAIKELHPEINIQCFLVTSMGNNAPTLGGIPVRELNDFIAGMSQEEKDNIEVLIGTPESVMDAIAKSLDEAGLHNYVKLDSMRWAKLQEMAFIKSGRYMPLDSYPDGVHIPDIKIFKMVHHKDKDLRTKYDDSQYITRLQVGATFADRTVADLQDNIQDNISDRNGNYSELTGLYWFWKNYILAGKADNGYVGLAHYRRFLEFSDDDLKKIQDNDIDVILPYPMPYEPNIEAHHLRYLSDSEWNAVLRALDVLQPEYAKAFKEILKQDYFYNYNVIVAKGEVLDNYCSWLFPLLFRIEELNDPKGEKQPNRYIGYVGETLETLYFMYNKDKLKIAHTGCRFLV